MADMGMLSFQTPEEVALARKAAEDARNMQMSQMGLGQSARYGMLSAGSALGNAIGAATGYVDPQIAKAQKIQQITTQFDTTTSEGMMQAAQALHQAGMPNEAAIAVNKAREYQANASKQALETAQTAKARAEADKAERQEPYTNLPPEAQARIKLSKLPVDSPEAKALQAYIDGLGVAKWSDPMKGPNGMTIIKNLKTNDIKVIDDGTPADGSGGGGGLGTQINPTTVDYYAAQSLAGDNSWQVGLARGKVGQQLIAAVKDRIPQMAKEQGITPTDAIATKQELVTKGSALKDFTSGPSAKAVRSFNVAIDHLDTLGELAVSLKNNDTRALNAIGNTVAKWSGSAAPTNFDAAKQAVASEVEKAIIGGQTAFGDRKEAMDKINGFSSPDQLVGYISTMKSLMAGQLKGLAHQYKTSTGRDDFERRLEPKALSVFNSSNTQPTPMSPGAFNAAWGTAKTGTKLIGPDGKTYTKK